MVWGEHVKFHINLKNMFDSPWRCSCDVSDVQSLNITVFYYRTCGWYCFLSDYGSLNCLLRAGGLTFYEHISLNVEPVISQIFSILSIARMILTFLHFYLLRNSHFMAITLDVEFNTGMVVFHWRIFSPWWEFKTTQYVLPLLVHWSYICKQIVNIWKGHTFFWNSYERTQLQIWETSNTHFQNLFKSTLH